MAGAVFSALVSVSSGSLESSGLSSVGKNRQHKSKGGSKRASIFSRRERRPRTKQSSQCRPLSGTALKT